MRPNANDDFWTIYDTVCTTKSLKEKPSNCITLLKIEWTLKYNVSF